MEHIVQFAIGVDDAAIVQKVSENAERLITNDLKNEVRKQVFTYPGYYGYRDDRDKPDGVQRWAEKKFEEFLEENKETIIELASEKLADKLSRSKVVKEAVAGKVIGKESKNG